MAVKNIEELYIQELRDLHSAERQIIDALPLVERAATTPELKKAVQKHLEETKGQLQRLDQIFQQLGERGTGHRCKAMEGLIDESKELIKDVEPGSLLDAALIVGAQKIEHYEIAGYGSARTFAEMLGKKEHAELLQETLDEEFASDIALTAIATSKINESASHQESSSATR